MNRRELLKALALVPGAAGVRELRVEPEDVLVVQAKDHLTTRAYAILKAQVQAALPGRKVLVFDGETTLTTLREVGKGERTTVYWWCPTCSTRITFADTAWKDGRPLDPICPYCGAGHRLEVKEFP